MMKNENIKTGTEEHAAIEWDAMQDDPRKETTLRVALNHVYYCWREVETVDGYLSQYLTGDGAITTDRDKMVTFATETGAEDHCHKHHEIGEAEFVSQSYSEKDPDKWLK